LIQGSERVPPVRGGGEELEVEIRGRQMAVETLTLTLLAHIAANSNDAPLFIAQIMDDVEGNLRRIQERAVSRDEQNAADYAMANFQHFTSALLAHIKNYGPSAG
jgi:hypothetical protein